MIAYYSLKPLRWKAVEQASSQTINFDKSVVAFSRNTPVDLQTFIGDLFQVPRAECHQRYLGLPSFMPQNRRGHLRFVKDRILK